eukprot:3608690-Amphidinium_carterae.1
MTRKEAVCVAWWGYFDDRKSLIRIKPTCRRVRPSVHSRWRPGKGGWRDYRHLAPELTLVSLCECCSQLGLLALRCNSSCCAFRMFPDIVTGATCVPAVAYASKL